MRTKKSEVATSPFSEEFPAPSHAHHIVDSNRDDSCRRVHVNGADMSNIFRAYRGRLNLCYWKTEDNQKVCEDAMELLNEILIERGCEPSVIISYVALVREVYSHACVNIKQMKISDERRRIEMLEQWRQIERHFLKVKHAMSDCWPIGNETDLLTVYLSLALLYSLYKDVCDEGVITVCFEAAQRARRCGAYRLSKNEFAEIQQYCDTIENIYFLRKQRVLNGQSYFVDEPFVDKRNRQNLGGPPPERAPYRRLPDGKAILAEYGKMTYNATTKMRKVMARTRALEALKLIQGAHAIRNDGKCPLVFEDHPKYETSDKPISPSDNVSESIKQLLNSIVGQVAGESVVESCDNLSNAVTNVPSSEPAFNGKYEPGLVQTDKVTQDEEPNYSLSSSAASNRVRRGMNRNDSIFVETTTITVETFETRTQSTDASHPKSTVRTEKPMRPIGVVRDQKVLVENYAELRLSDEEPPSLKETRFNLHTASVEGRSAEHVSQKQTSLSPSELPSPPPKCFPPSSTSPLSASPTETAAYRAMPFEVSLSSSIPATSTTSEILSPRTADSLLPGVSPKERPSHFLTNSSVTALLLHSTANVMTTLASPTPPLMHSAIEKNTISLAPKMHSPSLILPHSSLSLSSPSDPREALPLPTTTSVPSSTGLSIPPTTTSSSLVATTTPSPTASDSVPAAFPSPPPSPSNPSDSASPSPVAAPSVQIIKVIKDISASSAPNATSDSSKVISSPIVSPPSSSSPPPHSPPSYISTPSTAQHAFVSSPTTAAPSPPFTASCTSFSTNVSSATLPVAPFSQTMPLSTASPPPSVSTTSTSTSTVSSTPHLTTPSYSCAASPLCGTLTPSVLPRAVPSPPPLTADSSLSSAPIKSPNLPSPSQLPISTTPLPSKDVAVSPSLRPSAPPPPPPPLSACSDSLPALATSFSASVTTALAADSPPLTETMPPTHPSPSQSSGSPTTRPSVPPPPPPFSASSVFSVQSKSAVSSVLLSPRPPLHSLKQNPSATSPPQPVFLASSIFSELTPASATMLEATTPFESHSDSITPFRSSVSPRRPLYTPTSSIPHIVSLHGRTSVDTDALLSSFHNTSETLEQCTKRTLSTDSAYLHPPTSAIKTEDLSKNSEHSEEFIKQTTVTSEREIMNSEEMREHFESEGSLKTVTDHIAVSEVHQEIPLPGSLAMAVEMKETAIEKEIEDLEESVHKAVSTTHPYEMPASLNEASLAVLSQILNEHEISASDNASTEENRGYFPKTTCEAAERLSKKDVCDTCLISELATSWAANKSGDEWKTALEEESKNEHKALSANDSVVQCEKMFSLEGDVIPTDYGNPTGNVNVWREDEEQQEMENGSPGTHTKDNANLISFEEAMAKQVQAGAISANASDVSTVDATNDVPTALVRCTRYSFNKNQHDSGAKYSEIENDDAAMKLENEFVESDKQNNKYSVDDDTDSEVTSFSKFRSNAAISRQHKTTDQLSFDTQNHHDDTSFSLLNELKRSFAVERNTDNSQPVPPLLKQVKEVIECTQRTVDEDVENETQRIHLEEKAINDEESNVEEQSSDVEEISKRQPQGFIPMHEEIISAISTLRHVSDLPKPNFEDTADGASVAYRCSRISQPKHIERIFENPATASAGCLSTTDAEDRDSSASTPMTFFDPRLEFERRIKLKKNLKPKLDAPVIVKDIKATEISLKRFSGSRSSHDVSSESGKKTTSTTVSLDKDTNEPHTRSDSADSDGYYDTVSC